MSIYIIKFKLNLFSGLCIFKGCSGCNPKDKADWILLLEFRANHFQEDELMIAILCVRLSVQTRPHMLALSILALVQTFYIIM